MLAEQAGYEAGQLIWMGGDTHLYLNHVELVEEQLSREPSGDPQLEILRKPDSIFDYRFEDFTVTGYEPQGAIRAQVAV
jgi:thymidylate synthase